MRGFKTSLEDDIRLEEFLLKRIQKELNLLPKGGLKLGNNGRRIYYLPAGGKPKYVTPQSRRAAEITRRRILEKQKKIIEKNLKGEKRLSEIYEPYSYDYILTQISRVYQVVDSLAKQELERIPQADLKKGDRFEKERKHTLVDGSERMSKSEVILSMLYEAYGIPCQYEEPVFWPRNAPPEAQELKRILHLPDYVMPDFTFVFPDGRKKYHEHLGLMNDAGYMENWKKKMIVYYWAGITPGDNLIITADDRSGTFHQAEIAKIIESQLRELIGTSPVNKSR